MAVAQTYQGYFLEDGSFLVDGLPVRLPSKRRTVVEVFEDVEISETRAISQVETENHEKVTFVKKIIEEARAAEHDTLTESDWLEMANLRTKTRLSRRVEL